MLSFVEIMHNYVLVLCSQVDNALNLIELGISSGVKVYVLVSETLIYSELSISFCTVVYCRDLKCYAMNFRPCRP